MRSNVSWTLVIVLLFSHLATAQNEPNVETPAAGSADQGLRKQKKYAPYPEPDSGYVTDLADLLSRDEEERIEQQLWQVEAKTGVEIAVVTIGSIKDYEGSANSSIESFARGLFDTYAIGNLPQNDGVLFLVAKNDRKARIELGRGFGLARNADATRIMEDVIVPRFKREKYAQGVSAGVKAIMYDFAGVGFRTNWSLVALLMAIPLVGLLAFSLFKNGKRGWGWACVGILFILILGVLQIISTIIRNLPESTGDSSSSWGSSSSWSPGGYGGGFGGGSSGGGGATGSW